MCQLDPLVRCIVLHGAKIFAFCSNGPKAADKNKATIKTVINMPAVVIIGSKLVCK